MNSEKRKPRCCYNCGARTEWRLRKGEDREVEICPECGEVMFRNSKPCVGALIVRAGKVLLIRRDIDPFRGYWDIPGGFLEEGEHPGEGAVREALEETGLEISTGEILGIFMDSYCGEGGGATLNIYYLAEAAPGKAKPLAESSDVGWFPLGEIPEKLAFPNHARRVLELLIEKDFGGDNT